MQWQVVAIFRDENVRQQGRPWPTALNRQRRHRRLPNGLAIPAAYRGQDATAACPMLVGTRSLIRLGSSISMLSGTAVSLFSCLAASLAEGADGGGAGEPTISCVGRNPELGSITPIRMRLWPADAVALDASLLGPSVPSLYRFRHVNIRFEFTLCRRATIETDSPGTNVSSTIRRFKSRLYSR